MRADIQGVRSSRAAERQALSPGSAPFMQPTMDEQLIAAGKGRDEPVGSKGRLKSPLCSVTSAFLARGKCGGTSTQHVFQSAYNSSCLGKNILLLNHKLFLATTQLKKSYKKAKLIQGRRCRLCVIIATGWKMPERVTRGDFPT